MDIDAFMETLRNHEPIDEYDLLWLIRKVQDIFFQEKTLLRLTSPITVCGDVHGQFYDVLELFNVGGSPSNTKYLFLGDYVDRGYFSVETLALLFSYKVKYPDTFFMIRGNHECRQVNTLYGCYEEIMQRFGHAGLWKLCNDTFDLLPMAALIDNKVFCVHGGLSPSIKLIDQIALFDRRAEIPSVGPVSDLCWSDPDDIESWAISPRGAGYIFGRRPVREFCRNNKFVFIARAHQMAMEGYMWHFGEKQCVTVWSAPNYMYRSKNLASVMKVDEKLNTNFITFDAVPNDKRVIPEDSVPTYFA
ncbi:serine/threonine protein phosphatase [Tritrichomonas foetus]|uniref:Serine/threonine-protein phosphatase n=1 Tax=Tritrichomonas foetus TaxID=1144522 RepID=A0A1J4KVA5_9EUKA|nr:serine/threonine protein phosphatase [Tritrichomonas foetus]|eukprot:OHT13630.1 serine/threonine protein phosphatase [Tritrichomonas foetus]